MTIHAIIKVVCLSFIALPETLASISGLTLAVNALAGLAVLKLVAGLILAEMEPGLFKKDG